VGASATPGAPAATVAVATHDRPDRLAALLGALRAQTVDATAFEVVVVDDGSGPETAAVLAAERARGGLELVVLRHDTARGPSAARNAAWRAARAPLVAFTDDDCAPAPGWLAAGLEVHRRNPRAVVQGRTEPEPAGLEREGVLTRTLRVHRLGPWYETANMFYPRELLAELGGFDEAFGLRPGGEDTDLAHRALERGREAVFAPDALVHHAVEELGVRGTMRDAWRWTATVRVFADHPEMRAELTRGVFWSGWHWLVVRSLLALAAPRWLRRFLLLRHALQLHTRARREGAGWWAVPILLARDMVETVAVARGAVRYRTPVL
jgi:glycosyltransferase involved in cell wall biosynthesis